MLMAVAKPLNSAQPRPIPSLRWWIGGILFASTVINYIDRQTLSILAPFLKQDYHWTNVDYANITLVTNPSNHFPFGTLDCNGSGCHTTGNVNAGGFKLGTASIASPTLTAAGHTTATGAGLACATCHETAPYLGMIPSTSTV